MSDELVPSDPLFTPSRVVSLGVGIIYIVVAVAMGGVKGAVMVICFLFLPLACIWFPDVMASYTGWGLSRVAITKESPESFVYYGGWILVFLPVLAASIGELASM
ncbi:MAG TPA: hypothetical protein VJV23_02365 [Candidatus Polarisedimenticolia bacterium]|nr:hypothetical protein [Candidatus Polarisedimenticolia bacterium]